MGAAEGPPVTLDPATSQEVTQHKGFSVEGEGDQGPQRPRDASAGRGGTRPSGTLGHRAHFSWLLQEEPWSSHTRGPPGPGPALACTALCTPVGPCLSWRMSESSDCLLSPAPEPHRPSPPQLRVPQVAVSHHFSPICMPPILLFTFFLNINHFFKNSSLLFPKIHLWIC